MDFNSRRIVGSFVLPTSLCSPSSLFPDKPRMQPAEPRRDLPRRVGVSLLFLPLLPQVALNGFTLALTSVVTPRTMGAALPNNAALANGLLLGFSTLMNALSPFFGSVLDSRRNASLGIYAGAAVQTGGACCLLASDRLLSAGQSGLAIALFAIGIGAVRIGTVATTASVYALVSSYGSRYPGALGMLAACLGTANAIGGSVSFLCTALVTDDKTLYFVVVGSFTTGWLWALLFIPRRFLVLRRNSSPHATASLARARTAPRNSSCYATARTTDPTNDDDAPTPSEPAALSGAELPKGGSMADWPLIDAMDGPPGGAQEAEIESGRRSLDLVGAQQAEKAEENDDEDEGGDDDEEEEAEDAASRPSYGASPHRPLSAGISPTAPVGASSCCGHAALRRALTEWSGERYADWRRACLALLLFNMVVGVVIANGLFFVQDCTNVSADEAVSLYSYSYASSSMPVLITARFPFPTGEPLLVRIARPARSSDAQRAALGCARRCLRHGTPLLRLAAGGLGGVLHAPMDVQRCGCLRALALHRGHLPDLLACGHGPDRSHPTVGAYAHSRHGRSARDAGTWTGHRHRLFRPGAHCRGRRRGQCGRRRRRRLARALPAVGLRLVLCAYGRGGRDRRAPAAASA